MGGGGGGGKGGGGGGKGKGKEDVDVFDFAMSIDFGICAGPLDSINKIKIKDKLAWGGRVQGSGGTLTINKPNLFGGDDAEGGPVGKVELFLGKWNQQPSSHFKQTIDNDDIPGYRGLAHAFFRDKGNDPSLGFIWTTNNPYMPATEIAVTRLSEIPGVDYNMIYPYDRIENGEPVQMGNFLFTADDTDVGISSSGQVGDQSVSIPEDAVATVDRGDFSMNARIYGYCENQPLAGGGPGHGQITMTLIYRDEAGDTISTKSTGVVTGYGYLEASTGEHQVPIGTRSIYYNVTYNRIVPIAAYFKDTGVDAVLTSSPTIGGEPVDGRAHVGGQGKNMRRLPNVNAVSIIYELMTNTDFGLGEPESALDMDSFRAAAAQTYKELFGLSFLWREQMEIEALIQEVLNHIDAVFFINPATGKWTLTLLRGDYDASEAPLLDPSNCRARDRKRRAWGETVNEIIVKYTDPATEDSASVASHNLANITIQGGMASETRDYYMVRDKWLAQRIADRDVMASGYPIFTATLEVSRAMWQLVPGQVIRLTWPDDGITEMVCRVIGVDYGTPQDRTMTVSVSEDIFGLDQTAYGVVQEPEWVSQPEEPVDLSAIAIMAQPMPILTQAGVTAEELDEGYPQVVGAFYLADDLKVNTHIEVHTEYTLPTGDLTVGKIKSVVPTPSTLLTEDLTVEAVSYWHEDFVRGMLRTDGTIGRKIVLGVDEDEHEIAMLETYDENTGMWSVRRAIWDSIPRAWPTGTRTWAFPGEPRRLDPGERLAGETREFFFLPATRDATMEIENVTAFEVTYSERPYLPFRPANCQLDGNGFDGIEYRDIGDPTTFVASWSVRNRMTEDAVILSWTDASVTGEDGQTVTLEIYDEFDVLQNSITDLTGDSYEVQVADRNGVNYGYVKFRAARDGYLSLMGAERWFDLRQLGYGNGYGIDYG